MNIFLDKLLLLTVKLKRQVLVKVEPENTSQQEANQYG
jgi:hypothetical protein